MKRKRAAAIALSVSFLLSGCGHSLFEGDTTISLPTQEKLLPTSKFAYTDEMLINKYESNLPGAFEFEPALVGEFLSFTCLDYIESQDSFLYAYQSYAADTEKAKEEYAAYEAANNDYVGGVSEYNRRVAACAAWSEAFINQKLRSLNITYTDELSVRTLLENMQYLPEGQINNFATDSFLTSLRSVYLSYSAKVLNFRIIPAQFLEAYHRDIIKLLREAGVAYPGLEGSVKPDDMSADTLAAVTLSQLYSVGNNKSKMPFNPPTAPKMPKGVYMHTVLASRNYKTGEITTFFSQKTDPNLLPSMYAQKIPENGNYFFYFGGKAYFYKSDGLCYREVDMSDFYNKVVSDAGKTRPLKDYSLVNVSVLSSGSRIAMTILLEYAVFDEYADLPEDETELETAQEKADKDFIYRTLYCDMTSFDSSKYLNCSWLGSELGIDWWRWTYGGRNIYSSGSGPFARSMNLRVGERFADMYIADNGMTVCGFVGGIERETTDGFVYEYRVFPAPGAFFARYYTTDAAGENAPSFSIQDGSEVYNANTYCYLTSAPVRLRIWWVSDYSWLPYYLPSSLPIPFVPGGTITIGDYISLSNNLANDETILASGVIELNGLKASGYTAAFATTTANTTSVFMRRAQYPFEVVRIKNNSLSFAAVKDKQALTLLGVDNILALDKNRFIFASLENGAVLYSGGKVTQLLAAPMFRIWQRSDGSFIALGFDTEGKRYSISDYPMAGVMNIAMDK